MQNTALQSQQEYASAHTITADDALARLQTAPHGLSQHEAKKRLKQYGLNQLPQPEPPGVFRLFLSQFLSPLIYILLAAAVVSLFLEEFADAAFIAAVLLINAIIGTIQEFHAQRSAEALRSMVSSSAIVIRNEESMEIDAGELVPGDIVLLESGVKVPADIRLIHEFDLEVDESLLTGESLPSKKDPEQVLAEETPLGDRKNMLFSGSIINRGRGTGIVCNTGAYTEIGRLAEFLGEPAPKSPLIIRMEKFTFGIAVALFSFVIMLAAVEYFNGMSWNEVFLVSVALAVSAIPEGLPVALTVALTIGMNRMSKRSVIVRKLVAVEALGSCTVIASDKTGTLTMNQLTAVEVVLPQQGSIQISGGSNSPHGNFSSEELKITKSVEKQLHHIARAAVLCNEGFFGKHEGEWIGRGDAVDVALLVFGHKAGLIQADLLLDYPVKASIPYESDFGYAASLHEMDDHYLILVKGAPEQLFAMCKDMQKGKQTAHLDIAQLEEEVHTLAKNGYRTLAVAHAFVPKNEKNANFGRDDLKHLTMLGVIGMIDPLRKGAITSVAACHRAGIRACMITGDHPSTAFAIAAELNLVQHPEQVVTGAQLRSAEMEGESTLNELVAKANVFARVEPSQKVEIVRILENAGHFVAVTGDGANDAPALTASHVGVAMGKRGTDVAKECADLVIADDNFSSIVAGVEEGRIAYQNIRKVIFLLISTGAAELVLFFLSLLFALPLPLTAVQLLWLNLVTNGVQDVALAFEPREGHEMNKPPRKPDEPIFNRMMVERVIISAIFIGVIAFISFQSFLATGMDIDNARNSTLLLMVLFENVHAFNSRSETRSVLTHNPLGNPLLFFGIIIAQGIHIAAMYIPALNTTLGLAPVDLSHWLDMLMLALSLFILMETHKFIRRKWPLT